MLTCFLIVASGLLAFGAMYATVRFRWRQEARIWRKNAEYAIDMACRGIKVEVPPHFARFDITPKALARKG